MSQSRRKEILDAEVLLVVKRPDLGLIKAARLIFGVICVLFLAWLVVNTTASFGYKVALFGSMLILYVIAFFLSINSNPIILTEKGITQKLAQSLYWNEVEGFSWLPWTKNFLRLDLQPSGEASVLIQLNQIKGSFWFIHYSNRAEVEKIFQHKGLREII